MTNYILVIEGGVAGITASLDLVEQVIQYTSQEDNPKDENKIDLVKKLVEENME